MAVQNPTAKQKKNLKRRDFLKLSGSAVASLLSGMPKGWIGGAYAEQFPQNVRAMVLDGAIDPNADPIEEDLRQSAAFQKAFDDYAADPTVVLRER